MAAGCYMFLSSPIAALMAGTGIPAATLAQDFSTSLPANITFTRGSTAYYFNSSGVLTNAAIDVARIEYNSGTLAAQGLLLEGQRTNISRRSEELDQAYWVKTNSTITANNTTAPDNAATADKWDRTTTAAAYFLHTLSKAASALPYAQSAFAKKSVGDYCAFRTQGTYPNRADVIFNITNGTIATAASVNGYTAQSARIETCQSSWYRGYLNYTTLTSTTLQPAYSFNANNVNTDGVDSADTTAGFLWGMQLEQADFPSSYILVPDGAADVTRSADSALMTDANFSNWWNASAGSTVINAISPGVGTRVIWQYDDNTANNRFVLYTTGTTLMFDIITASVTVASLTLGTITAYTAFKAAVSYALNDIAGCLNGGTVQTDIVAALPTVNRARFGASTAAGEELFGWLKTHNYYNTALSDANLQSLST